MENNSTSNHAGERIISDSERKERWQRYLGVPKVVARLATRGTLGREGLGHIEEPASEQKGIEQ